MSEFFRGLLTRKNVARVVAAGTIAAGAVACGTPDVAAQTPTPPRPGVTEGLVTPTPIELLPTTGGDFEVKAFTPVLSAAGTLPEGITPDMNLRALKTIDQVKKDFGRTISGEFMSFNLALQTEEGTVGADLVYSPVIQELDDQGHNLVYINGKPAVTGIASTMHEDDGTATEALVHSYLNADGLKKVQDALAKGAEPKLDDADFGEFALAQQLTRGNTIEGYKKALKGPQAEKYKQSIDRAFFSNLWVFDPNTADKTDAFVLKYLPAQSSNVGTVADTAAIITDALDGFFASTAGSVEAAPQPPPSVAPRTATPKATEAPFPEPSRTPSPVAIATKEPTKEPTKVAVVPTNTPAPTVTPEPTVSIPNGETDYSNYSQEQFAKIYDGAQKMYNVGQNGKEGQEIPLGLYQYTSTTGDIKVKVDGILLTKGPKETVSVDGISDIPGEPVTRETGAYKGQILIKDSNGVFYVKNILIQDRNVQLQTASNHEDGASTGISTPVEDVVNQLDTNTQHAFVAYAKTDHQKALQTIQKYIDSGDIASANSLKVKLALIESMGKDTLLFENLFATGGDLTELNQIDTFGPVDIVKVNKP